MIFDFGLLEMLKRFLLGLVFILLNCCYCDEDVRLGANRHVPCPQATLDLQRILLRPPGDVGAIYLYRNEMNLSTEKYVLSADFSTITVRDMTVSDEGEYSCEVYHGASNRRLPVTPVTISVYGESSAISQHPML